MDMVHFGPDTCNAHKKSYEVLCFFSLNTLFNIFWKNVKNFPPQKMTIVYYTLHDKTLIIWKTVIPLENVLIDRNIGIFNYKIKIKLEFS